MKRNKSVLLAVIALAMFFVAGLGMLHAQDNWILNTPATRPSARCDLAMSNIGGDQVLLFGGGRSSAWEFNSDETWVYCLSNDTWTLKNPVTKPRARAFHAMAYIGDDKVLLFGGNGEVPLMDDTWVYDLSDNTWTQTNPSTKPSGRYLHAMAYLGDDKVLLFGGWHYVRNDETWVYDLSDNTWTLGSPITKPPARCSHAMASLSQGRVLLFGGEDVGTTYDDTWVYDLSGNIWTLKSPATKPSARYFHSMATFGRDKALLFGGVDRYGRDDETWVYGLPDNVWTLKGPATKPSARCEHAIATVGDNQVLLFGGYYGARDNETWVYGASGFAAPTLLANGGFEQGLASWSGGGCVTPGIVTTGCNSSNAAKILINGANCSAQFYQRGFAIERGKRYRVSFNAWSSRGEDMQLTVLPHNASAFNIGLDRRVDLGTNPCASYSFEFIATGSTSDARLRFMFNYMSTTGYWYCFDNVVVEKVLAKEGIAENEVPASFQLEQNYPNPFNPTTEIRYSVPSGRDLGRSADGQTLEVSHVTLKVYDMLGREVTTLVNETKEPGYYSVQWNASGIASGVYFYRLHAGDYTATRRLVFLK